MVRLASAPVAIRVAAALLCYGTSRCHLHFIVRIMRRPRNSLRRFIVLRFIAKDRAHMSGANKLEVVP